MPIHPLDIPLGHLYSQTPFPKIEYTPEQEEMNNLLFNRQDYTQGRQNEQVGKLLADVKTSEILPDLQQRAVERIRKFTDDFKGLYSSQRNQLKLSTDNQLKASMLKQELMQDLSSMEQLTKDYHKENQNLTNYVKDELITPQEAILADQEFRNAIRTPGKSFMDMPFFSAFMAQKIRPKENDWLLKLDKLMEVPVKNGLAKSKLVNDPKTGGYLNVTDDYDSLPDVSPLIQAYPSIYSGLIRTVGTDPAKQAEFLKGRYDRKGGQTFAGGVPHVSVNNGGGNKQPKEPLVIPKSLDNNNNDYWDLSAIQDKPKWSGVIYDKNDGAVSLQNAQVLQIIRNPKDKKLSMIVQGKAPGGTNTYNQEVPFVESVNVQLANKNLFPDGLHTEYTDAATYNAQKNTYGKATNGKDSGKKVTEADKYHL